MWVAGNRTRRISLVLYLISLLGVSPVTSFSVVKAERGGETLVRHTWPMAAQSSSAWGRVLRSALQPSGIILLDMQEIVLTNLE